MTSTVPTSPAGVIAVATYSHDRAEVDVDRPGDTRVTYQTPYTPYDVSRVLRQNGWEMISPWGNAVDPATGWIVGEPYDMYSSTELWGHEVYAGIVRIGEMRGRKVDTPYGRGWIMNYDIQYRGEIDGFTIGLYEPYYPPLSTEGRRIVLAESDEVTVLDEQADPAIVAELV